MLAAQPAGRRFARVGCAASITAIAPVAPQGWLVSGNGGVPPLPSPQRVGQRRRRAASHGVAPPLRPPASLLHKAAFHKVRCSRCAKAPLGAPHRCAPFGFMKQALCKVASAPSCCVRSSGFWPGASRSTPASGLRPCRGPAPARPRGLAASRLWPARPARPPPKGAPSARARGAESHSGLRPLCTSLSPVSGQPCQRITRNRHNAGVFTVRTNETPQVHRRKKKTRNESGLFKFSLFLAN